MRGLMPLEEINATTKGDLMCRTLAVAFLLMIGLVNATTARAQTVAKPVKVGDAAPNFTLVDYRGNKVTLSDSKGKSPVLLVFYRGYW